MKRPRSPSLKPAHAVTPFVSYTDNIVGRLFICHHSEVPRAGLGVSLGLSLKNPFIRVTAPNYLRFCGGSLLAVAFRAVFPCCGQFLLTGVSADLKGSHYRRFDGSQKEWH